jgi:Tol biopolymer transport system component/type II secretory pathway pseudopilin PulG
MQSILTALLRLVLTGSLTSDPAPGARLARVRGRRSGFMILISLIAVAMAGLLMVSTAPDLSSATASLRSRELSLALGTLRRAVRNQPLYLTSTGFTYKTASGDQQYRVGDYYTPEALESRLRPLTIQEQESAGGGVLGAGASFLTTIPIDPMVPFRDWFNPSTNPQGVFWGSSYNFVKNPTFLSGTALEAYVAESLGVYTLRPAADSKQEIWWSDRFGQNAAPIVTFRGADSTDPALSGDGSRIAYQSARLSGWDIFVVSGDGSLETQITKTPGSVHETHPIWSPTGHRLLFRRSRPPTVDSDELVMTTPIGANPTVITTGSWLPMTIQATYDWSPSGRFIAYAYKRSGMSKARIAIYDVREKSHLVPPTGTDGPECSETCNLSISPDSEQLAYALSDGSELWSYYNLSTTRLVRRIAEADEGPFEWVRWIPESVRPAANVTGRWIVFVSSGSRLAAGPYLARQRVPEPPPFAGRHHAFLVSRTNPIEPKSVALSTYAAFASLRTKGAGGAPRLVTIDGARESSPLTSGVAGPAVPSPFSATQDSWVIPPSNAQLVSSSNRAAFDGNAWRAFVTSQSDFDGDNRFGSTYLRISPPGRQRHFLLDNGTDTFLVEDDVTIRGKPRAAVKSFLNKVTPTWSPRGLTFIARKSKGSAGEPPMECFKEAVDVSATTVLITTAGFEPALSPDDKLLAVSQPMAPVTTDVPSRTDFPILNMDLWLANAAGAPEPPAVNLTPGTGEAQERAPAWSPDGKYIYYQRETQESNSFLGNHNSTIFRITVNGGADTEVVGNSQVAPYWNTGSAYRSRVECYSPSVSPDGLRLAFVGKERILSAWGPFAAGDIISEVVYLKDLVYDREPAALVRSAHPEHPSKPPGPPENNDYTFDSISWAPNGEEIFAVRTKPINLRFPQWTNDSHKRRLATPDYVPNTSELIRVIPRDPKTSERGTAGLEIGVGLVDPANDNFLTLFGDGQVTGLRAGDRILNARYSQGAYVFQRISSDRPVLQRQGISTDVWYALSGYLRTSPSASHFHKGQIMIQLFNNRGLLVPQVKGSKSEFEVGLTDLGGPHWQRFSGAVRFEESLFDSKSDLPPYSMNLCLYSIAAEVGSWVEFTALKMEKAFDQQASFPTAFAPDWTVFSASKDPDPVRAGFFLFER